MELSIAMFNATLLSISLGVFIGALIIHYFLK